MNTHGTTTTCRYLLVGGKKKQIQEESLGRQLAIKKVFNQLQKSQ